MKNLFSGILLCAALAALAAQAQSPGLYSPANLWSGGNVVTPFASTNVFYVYTLTNGVQNGVVTTNRYGAVTASTNLTLNVSEYDYAGITQIVTADNTSTNAAVGVAIYRSYDFGTTYETAGAINWTNSIAAPGGIANTYQTNWDIHGVTTLAFKFYNLAAAGQATNYFKVNLKAPRLSVQPAGIYGGTTPGTPIAVPNFP